MNNIIGQETLINNVKRVLKIFKNSQSKIRPHFILTGSSGSGKSFTIRSIVKELDLAFLDINAAQLTKEGTSGNSLSKALSPLLSFSGKPAVVFVDEFDKLFISGNSNSDLAHESTTAVQNEFLKVLESDVSAVFGDYGKYVNVNTGNILFVFAGAFNGEENITLDRLREIGLKTEFLGRVGLVFNTSNLTIDNLYQILDNSELLENYLKLFTDVDREKVLYELKAHIQRNHEMNTLGARMVNTLINQYFISGGKLETEAPKVTFQTKLSLNDM
jgi:ATP-dependent protease Clp ATPase subunit